MTPARTRSSDACRVFFLPDVAEKRKNFWLSDSPKSCRSGSGFDLHLTCIICRFPCFFVRFPLAQHAKREKEKAPQTAQLCGLWGFLFWPARRDPGPCFSRGEDPAQPLIIPPRKAALLPLAKVEGFLLTYRPNEAKKTPRKWCLFCLARPEGFEPPAFGIGIHCDIQLRHGRI